jgi:hypothetical protein
MAIVFDGTTLNWYTHTITFDGSTVSSPNDPGTVTFDGTTVHGLTGFSSETTLTTLGLAPDSSDIENWVSALTTEITDAFHSHGYTQGPGTDTRYTMYLKEGYRWVTGDGTFVGTASPGTSVVAYSGQSVTGFNTSHNGGVSGTLRRDNGV